MSADGLASLRAAIGAAAVTAVPEDTAPYALGGAPPVAVASPATPAAAAAALRWAAAAGCTVLPRGAGSRQQRWRAPAGPWLALSTRRLDALLELNADNLTATFGAGATLAAVAAALAPADLYCPPLAHLPAGHGPDDSLGGALAARLSGPQRTRHGALRAWVLALQLVTPAGEVVQLGVPTVKNVAGYDLVKLHIGARGSLGLITAVTLRLLKLPPEQATLAAAFASPEAAIATLQGLAATANAPVAAELLDATTAAALGHQIPEGGALALLELAGSQVAPWQNTVALTLVAAGASPAPVGAGIWDAYARLPLTLAGPWPVRLATAVPPVTVHSLWEAAATAGARTLCSPAAGTTHLLLAPTPDLTQRLTALRRELTAAGGYAELVAGPPEAAAALPPAFPSALDRAVQNALDPDGRMHVWR